MEFILGDESERARETILRVYLIERDFCVDCGSFLGVPSFDSLNESFVLKVGLLPRFNDFSIQVLFDGVFRLVTSVFPLFEPWFLAFFITSS